MNCKILCAAALASALALGFVWLGPQSVAQGQKPEKAQQQLEYKIYRVFDGDFTNEKAEAAFNKFAAEGWEFVETIVSRAPLPNNVGNVDRNLAAHTCILFKRAKK